MITYLKQKQSGRSMIEMLGVLAIVGVLSAGGIAGYSMAMQSYKTTQLVDKVNLITARVRQLYKGQYSSISSADLVASGKVSDNDMDNPFGGKIGLMRNPWEYTDGTAFYLQLGVIPAETCTDLLMTDWGSSGVFEGVHMGYNTGHGFRYKDNTWPVAAADAITACKDGTTFFNIIFK